MKKRILVLGSIIAVVVLVLAAFPSVVSSQVSKANTEQVTTVVSSFFDRFTKDAHLQDVDGDELSGLLQQIRRGGADDAWEPGMLIALFLAIMFGALEAIAQGEWFPGMVFGAFILYLILAWLIIFGQSTPS